MSLARLHRLLPFGKPLALATLACVATTSASVTAQEVGSVAEKSEWLSMVVGVFLIALVCLGSFLGSKRGHLD